MFQQNRLRSCLYRCRMILLGRDCRWMSPLGNTHLRCKGGMYLCSRGSTFQEDISRADLSLQRTCILEDRTHTQCLMIRCMPLSCIFQQGIRCSCCRKLPRRHWSTYMSWSMANTLYLKLRWPASISWYQAGIWNNQGRQHSC